jgi:HD superfamily phosphodiesterase
MNSMEFTSPRAKLIKALIAFFDDDNGRIEHALRVLFHAECIMQDHEGFDLDIVVATALLHDVGIKISEEKLGMQNGKTQEEYGPPVAEELLLSVGFPGDKIEKVKDIIGNHHSPSRYDYVELEILKKADRIVNEVERV